MPYQTMFDNFFSSQRPLFSLGKRVWNPPTDIRECEDVTEIKIEVAGLDESQLQVLAERNLLIVRGSRQQPLGQSQLHYHLMEIHYGQFERVFAFSHPLEESSIRADYEKGFILIRVLKKGPRATQVTIQIAEDEAPQG